MKRVIFTIDSNFYDKIVSMNKAEQNIGIEFREKPPFLFHGTTSPSVEEFEPRNKSTPGIYKGKDVPDSVYAGDDPAYCAAHSFSWGSAEGFELGFKEGKVVFVVPNDLSDRLNVKVYVYKIPSDKFELLEDVAPLGHNYWAQQKVKPVSFEEFNSVREAVEHYGGEVRYK